MAETDRPTWLRPALLAGAAYLIIGLGFSTLARLGGPAWRPAAWGLSAVVFGLHIRRELARPGASSGARAFHAAVGVALGAFGLALVATLRAVLTAQFRFGFILALAAWPLLTGVPAFVAAWAIIAALRRTNAPAGS